MKTKKITKNSIVFSLIVSAFFVTLTVIGCKKEKKTTYKHKFTSSTLVSGGSFTYFCADCAPYCVWKGYNCSSGSYSDEAFMKLVPGINEFKGEAWAERRRPKDTVDLYFVYYDVNLSDSVHKAYAEDRILEIKGNTTPSLRPELVQEIYKNSGLSNILPKNNLIELVKGNTDVILEPGVNTKKGQYNIKFHYIIPCVTCNKDIQCRVSLVKK